MLVGKNWTVVLSRNKAKFLTVIAGPARKLKLVDEISNPLGRTRNRDMQTSHRIGEKDPHEDAAVMFIGKICDQLEKLRYKKKFDALIVAAEPHLMGILKKKMKSPLKTQVVKWVNKDLEKIPLKDLPGHLALDDI
jgi:protein required for attachment to host cells